MLHRLLIILAVDVQKLDCDFLAFSGHKFTVRQVSVFYTVKKNCLKVCLHIWGAEI